MSRHDIARSLTARPGQRQPQLVEDGKLSAEFNSVDSSFVEALQEEEAHVAQHHDADVKKDDEDVDGKEIAQIATCGVPA